MRKLIVFLMVLSLIFMSIPSNVFAIFEAVNVGPDTDFAGDINIPSGKSYYINSTLLAVGDITDALNVTMANVGATAINAALIPDSEDDTDLGSATYEWCNIYVGEAGKIYLRKDQSVNLQATGAGILTLTAANGVVTSNALTVGGTLALGANNLTMTGSLGATGAGKLTKVWAVDMDVTNAIAGSVTGNAGTVTFIADEADNEENELLFADDAAASGNAIVAADSGLTYNPSTGVLTSAAFAGDVTGDLTGTADTAAEGDAAVDFFGAGIDAVTDETTCTDIEGDLLSITTSVLNVTIPADHITGDMITTVNCGTNCTWDADADAVDVDDVFLLHAGDVASGVHDFGGATSFEIPNADSSPANTGEIILDTDVADMTNGNLAFYDGTAIRYVVSLAVGDIWSNDDYVVAYDAEGDKFYMKEDTSSAGNFMLHLMDVNAAGQTDVHARITTTGDHQEITDGMVGPDFGRNIVVFFADVGASTGDVTITGNLADGTTAQDETFTVSAGAVTGAKAFVVVTEIDIPATFVADVKVDVGTGELIGLANSIDGVTDVYMKTVDGVEEFGEIADNVNTANNTLDCATIAANEDITIYYHN